MSLSPLFERAGRGEFDWDLWRSRYDDLTFEEQARFADLCYRFYPVQASYDWGAARRFFSWCAPQSVVEIGGWTGTLAQQTLVQHSEIRLWVNYDFCRSALENSEPTDPRYQTVLLTAPAWEREYRADAFVATHVFEHMKAAEIDKLIPRISSRLCYIEAPLNAGGQSWAGYDGTHILEIGWDGLTELMVAHGWRPVAGFDPAGVFERR